MNELINRITAFELAGIPVHYLAPLPLLAVICLLLFFKIEVTGARFAPTWWIRLVWFLVSVTFAYAAFVAHHFQVPIRGNQYLLAGILAGLGLMVLYKSVFKPR